MKKTFCSRLFSMVLATAMVLSTFAIAFADETGRFSDVPTSHWAYANIEALAAGKLVQGVGGGKFAPDDRLTIAQMATIIANAKGAAVGTGDGKWYYKAVKGALDSNYLPRFSDNITDGTYERVCTRELAIYMVIEALGILPGAENTGKSWLDIPDYSSISRDYADAVTEAVKYGVIKGVDSTGRVDPKGELTRAQICAILDRAGYRTAAERAVETTDGMTNEQIYEAIKATGMFNETETVNVMNIPVRRLVAKERKHALLRVDYEAERERLTITANEFIDELVFDKNFNVLKEDGTIFEEKTDASYEMFYADGRYAPASGLNYSSRQLLKQIFEIAFPGNVDKCTKIMTSLFVNPPANMSKQDYPTILPYTGNSSYPSVMEWLNGHGVFFNAGVNDYEIIVFGLNDIETYDEWNDVTTPSWPKDYQDGTGRGYVFFSGSKRYVDTITAHELNRW